MNFPSPILARHCKIEITNRLCSAQEQVGDRGTVLHELMFTTFSSEDTKNSSAACLPSCLNVGRPERPVPSQSMASKRKCGASPSMFLYKVTHGACN